MKKFLIFMILTCSLLFIYLLIAGKKIQTIRTEIQIKAPIEKVWGFVTDINSWHEWSPIINHSQGVPDLGETLQITMAGNKKGENGPHYTPIITKIIKPNHLEWRAYMITGFIFTNDKIIKLKKTPTGTEVLHMERFSGLLSPIFASQMKKFVPDKLKSMNQALKEALEN